tara:strand:- start:191 stop:1027 length:837 start_codon:yes stop_codon:yes gene_type:complete
VEFVYSADFFAHEINGGAELNDMEVIKLLHIQGEKVSAVHSEELTPEYINENKDSNYIVSNFIKLSEESKRALLDCKYVIYEHDHKYLKSRNPGQWKDLKAPAEEIVNLEFYKSAAAILCQSGFHAGVIKKNLNLDNIINLSGNLWSESALDLLEIMSEKEKAPKCSIMDSLIPSKNTGLAIKYCKAKKINYQLVKSASYQEFLTALTANESLAFFPSTPETLSRIVVEARMAGMKVYTNSLVGASHEEWFSLKGKPLIELMRARRTEIADKIRRVFE